MAHYGIGEDSVIWMFLRLPYPHFSEWLRTPTAQLHKVGDPLVPCTRIARARAVSLPKTNSTKRALREAEFGCDAVDLGPVGMVTFATVGYVVTESSCHLVVAAAGGPIRADQPLLLHFEFDSDYPFKPMRLELIGGSDKVSHPWLRRSGSRGDLDPRSRRPLRRLPPPPSPEDVASANAASADSCDVQVGFRFVPYISGYSINCWIPAMSYPAIVYDTLARLFVEPESWDTDNSWLRPWAASAECFTSGDVARWKEDWNGALAEWASAWRGLGPRQLLNDEEAWIESGLATRWTPRLHHRTPRRVQRAVFAVLLVAEKLRRRTEGESEAVVMHLPAMPAELWFLVLECAFPLSFTVLDP